MRRLAWIVACSVATGVSPLSAQAVPDESQAARVDPAYRRTPTLLVDPFRHVMIPHWGFVFSVGASAENNTFNLSDIGAAIFLDDRDSLLFGDIIDLSGLIPTGAGLSSLIQVESGLYLGGPFGSHLNIGLSGQGRAYGAFHIDDDAIALIRDGNALRQDFSFGTSAGVVLATAEAGLHAVARLSPIGSIDGARISIGFGGRQIRPLFYARGRAADSGMIRVTQDSIEARFQLEWAYTPDADSLILEQGSGLAADFLVRVDWPSSGIAFEAVLANLGKVTIERVERRRFDFDVATTLLDSVLDEIDSTDFDIQDTVDLDVTLPRIARFSASAWANQYLQLDVSATLPVSGDFDSPLRVDLGTTWRFSRVLPLRLGVVIGGRQGTGYIGGFAVEGRNTFLQVTGASLGGLFRKARGASGRFELGFFF